MVQFEAAVAREPQNELFHFSLAQALATAGRVDEAVPHWKFCIARRPDWMLPHIALGKYYFSNGEFSVARPFLEQALQLAVDQKHDDPAAEVRGLLASLPRSP